MTTVKMYTRTRSFRRVQLFSAPWTAAPQDPLSVGYSRQEYWSGLPCPLRGAPADSGVKPMSPVAVVQPLSHVLLVTSPGTAARQASLSFTLSQFAQTRVHRVGDAIQPSHPLSHFSCPQSFPASGSFPVSQLFASGGQVLEVRLQHQ